MIKREYKVKVKESFWLPEVVVTYRPDWWRVVRTIGDTELVVVESVR